MAESTLINISLFMAIIGIIILFFISDKIKIKEYNLNEISEELIDKEIKINGKIEDIKELKNSLLLTLSENKNKLKVIIYKKDKIVGLKKNQMIEVTGKLKIYEKEFEIEAEEIKIIS